MTASALALPLAPLRRAARALVDLVIPARCPACGGIVPGDGQFCAPCWAELRFITAPHCACCGDPFTYDLGPGAICEACRETPPRFASARAPFGYQGSAARVVLGFKNRGREHLARIMAPPMIRAAGALLAPDVLLVPVPLHRWRLLRRGFNQAALLAQAIGRAQALDVAVDALVRVRASPRSRGMGRQARAANVRGVFRVARPALVRGRTVVLVDDVLTTGATATAATRLLLRAGARQVHIVTFARVVAGDDPRA